MFPSCVRLDGKGFEIDGLAIIIACVTIFAVGEGLFQIDGYHSGINISFCLNRVLKAASFCDVNDNVVIQTGVIF